MHWILTALCAVLGVVDVTLFLKTPKEMRTKLHPVLFVCGIVVLILAVLNTIKLLTNS